MMHTFTRYILLAVCTILGSSGLLFAQQSTDYDVDPSTGYRMERYRAPVPADIPGGTTLDIVSAVSRHANKDILFIDVYPPKGLGPDPLDGHWVTGEVRESIPGAIWLPEVGRGFLEADALDYLQRNMARLTNNKLDAPVAFFCTSDCWQSWNASKRVIDMGYTAVHWFPLGSDGWLEAGQPLQVVQPINFIDDTTPAVAQEPSDQEPSDNASTDNNDSQTLSPFPASGTIYLIDQNDKELAIGQVTFTPINDESARAEVLIESPEFDDQFLSMRPFDCITEPAEWFCYLEYPYELHKLVSVDDLTELEYQLLFIWKSPKTHGIDAWNGVYYQLSVQEDGSISGKLLQGDLNVLASPPEAFSHPIDLDEFIEQGADNRLFPSLVIRP